MPSETKYTVDHYLEKIGVDGTDYTDHYTLEFSEVFYGIADSRIEVMSKNIEGFTPLMESSYFTIPSDGNGHLKLYYLRNKYNLTILNSRIISDKNEYDFDEEVNLSYTKYNGATLYTFDSWIFNVPVKVKDNSTYKNTIIYMPANNLSVNAKTKMMDRLNSNIYKNIFEYSVIDLWNIRNKIAPDYHVKTYTRNITQCNHDFVIGDLVYLDQNNVYQKALANKNEYKIEGMILQIIDENNFTIMRYGKINMELEFMSGSGILYLSDVNKGKFCRYEDITNMFYTPVAFYTGDSIILNIMDSSIGDILKEYNEKIIEINSLTFIDSEDREDIINEVWNNII